MADQLVKKIELNVDCGEGFGRWKMVRPRAKPLSGELNGPL
jgi:hypothetical protein